MTMNEERLFRHERSGNVSTEISCAGYCHSLETHRCVAELGDEGVQVDPLQGLVVE
jgi:hypothetical protein